ncbi:isochorismatase family protein [Aromatoleum toluvorans]|uniref:Isochorismatase family protein n=1 Tax=Aromatoleum toluvorans TaxID=92002 RepID=A0ABX1PU98_9RHOO|nr:isochorismatase family protein [Aromatoleum toluvorans]NMG42775.1 isochorismatase family protein [Aromatoleum toluvorans]
MLMNREKSVLLIVDVQERLAPAIDDGDAVVRNCAWLAGVAGRMGVPVVVSEHFPEKIGSTVAEVKAAAVAAGAQFVTKEFFSAETDGCLKGTAIDDRRQVVVCGTEAHVCVQQTALGLRWAGHDVFVVADAAGSRRASDRELALARMRGHGIEIVAREMVAFEWLKRGGTDLFREVNRDFIR